MEIRHSIELTLKYSKAITTNVFRRYDYEFFLPLYDYFIIEKKYNE